MNVYCNGFWDGFKEETDGVHFGFFKEVLSRTFNMTISVSDNIDQCQILLESHFIGRTLVHTKPWKYTIFFSGEGLHAIPDNGYTLIMGAHCLLNNNTYSYYNFVPCPLGLVYHFSAPKVIQNNIPKTKGVCAVISSDAGHPVKRQRSFVVDEILNQGIQIDFGGQYKNNIGYAVQGNYTSQNLIDFYSQYKVVLAFENSVQEYYITEKVINALRAGAIPFYFGTSKIFDFIPKERIITSVEELKLVLTDEEYYQKKLQVPDFIRPMDVFISETINRIRNVLNRNTFFPVMISNRVFEKRLSTVIETYNIETTYTVWSNNTKFHPYWNKFQHPDPVKLNQNQISLAINHIGLFESHQHYNKHLLVLESDAVPTQDDIDISKIVDDMKKYDIDFVFLGKGCFPDARNLVLHHADNWCRFDINIPNAIKYGDNLYKTQTSRCTEAYIVSPNGMKKYLHYFYTTPHHTAIDGDFNRFFYHTGTISCWFIPELFYQDPTYVSYLNTDQDLV